jgi:hypothetical protein
LCGNVTGFSDMSERAAQSLGVNLRSRGIGEISEVNDVMAAMKADGAVTLIECDLRSKK